MAAAAVIGVCAAACGTQVTTGQPSPPKLRLTGIPAASSPGPQQAGSPGPGVQPGGPASPGASGPARVELAGPLPASGPSHGTVWQLRGGPASRSEVRTLAAALHLTGAPHRSGSGWRVTGPGTLQVSDGPGLRWSYTGLPAQPCAGPIEKYATAERHGPAPGRIELTALACPQAGPSRGSLEPYGPVPGRSGEPGPPSPQAAEAAAVPVLHAAGVSGSRIRASVTGTVTSVSADPSIQGLPTAGLPTVVRVGPSGAVTAANGWLGRPVPGTVYPLVSAAQAAQALGAAASRAGGGNPPVLRVTGAVYGLALGYDGTGAAARPVLVPAWLLQVAGSAGPVPAVAISPRYLAAG